MSLPVVELAEIFGNPFFPVLGWRCYRLGGTDGHQEFFCVDAQVASMQA